jgi:hypothetical protein
MWTARRPGLAFARIDCETGLNVKTGSRFRQNDR